MKFNFSKLFYFKDSCVRGDESWNFQYPKRDYWGLEPLEKRIKATALKYFQEPNLIEQRLISKGHYPNNSMIISAVLPLFFNVVYFYRMFNDTNIIFDSSCFRNVKCDYKFFKLNRWSIFLSSFSIGIHIFNVCSINNLFIILLRYQKASIFGNEALDMSEDWKKCKKQKIAVSFISTYDHNGALANLEPTGLFAQNALEKNIHPLVFRVNSSSEIRDILKFLKDQDNQILMLMFSAHGNPSLIIINVGDSIDTNSSQIDRKSDAMVAEIFEMLDEGCQVYLNSCLAGSSPELPSSIGLYLAKKNPKIQVIAPVGFVSRFQMRKALNDKCLDLKFGHRGLFEILGFASLFERIGIPIGSTSVFEFGDFKKYI